MVGRNTASLLKDNNTAVSHVMGEARWQAVLNIMTHVSALLVVHSRPDKQR